MIELATLNPLCCPNSYLSELQSEAAEPGFYWRKGPGWTVCHRSSTSTPILSLGKMNRYQLTINHHHHHHQSFQSLASIIIVVSVIIINHSQLSSSVTTIGIIIIYCVDIVISSFCNQQKSFVVIMNHLNYG